MEPETTLMDWNRLFEVLVTLIVLAFFVERALSLLFEWRHFVSRFAAAGLKEPLAFVLALLVTWQWKFDALGVVMDDPAPSFIGQLITAAVIAGGSKASIKLFKDIAGVGNTVAAAREELRREDDARAVAVPPPAQ